MNHPAWQCLSVREFINVCNWENRAIAQKSNSGDRIQRSLASWRCLTARDFFSLYNWSGKAVYVESSRQSIAPVAFTLTLPTDRFWQCFNWTGKANSSLGAISEVDEAIEYAEEARKAKRGGLGGFPHEPSLQEDVAGVPPVKSIEQEAIAAVEEFTLNDLSQLF